MFPNDSRRERRSGRPRRRPGRVAVEGLEVRRLMAYSPFGFSLPQFSVTGYAAPTAAYGGTVAVEIDVENRGASSLIEPTALAPGSTSTADSGPTTVQVYASTRPGATSGLLLLDTISVPSIRQNSDFVTVATVPLPARSPGFPAVGGKFYLTLVVNNNQAVLESSTLNNIYRVPDPVRISDPLPDLQVVAFDVPPSLQPGEVITPTIRIANFGSGNPAAQRPVLVELVASLNKTFGPGDAVVASYTIGSLPGVSGVPTEGPIGPDSNLIPPQNVNTTTLPPLKLPTAPGFYYFGVKIDPFSAINQTYPPNPSISALTPVGPPGQFLPPGGLLFKTNGVVPVFPALPSTVINPLAVPPVTVFPPIFPNPSPVNLPPTSPGPVTLNPALSAESLRARHGHGHLKPVHVHKHKA